MESIKSFKGYGKVDELEEQAFRRKTLKRLIILIVSSTVLLAAIIGVVAGTVIHKQNPSESNEVPSTPTSSAASLKTMCSETLYPDACYSSINALEESNTTDPEEIFKISLQIVLNSLTKLSSFSGEWANKTNDESLKVALGVCQEVLEDAIDRVSDSISHMNVNEGEKIMSVTKIDDLKTWLSTTMTDQETCLDALEELNSTALPQDWHGLMKNSTEFASNSLAIVARILDILSDLSNIPIHRKLLGMNVVDFPDWVGHGDRRLLKGARPRPQVTVAKDGSGDVRTIKQAVERVPKKSKARFVIYVKAGTYVENVVLDKSKWNVMMYGDGKTKTIVSGSLNVVDGTPTFSTAPFIVAGRGFIAKNMGFKNTAGPEKHQAVALRSGSDLSIFYNCSFDAFQDTLYAHSNRQFYRNCDITGTVDFIFGNAAVVFQNCSIQPRQPLPNQFVTITAQGKNDPNQNTGISIQKCTISPLNKLTVPTYLGRPWKNFSTTVIMQSTIGDFIEPSGWVEWIRNVEPPKTIFYAEYQNTGPGARVDKRVKWVGYKPTITAKQASKFTVQSFIQGNNWLPAANVLFDLSL